MVCELYLIITNILNFMKMYYIITWFHGWQLVMWLCEPIILQHK